MEGGNRHYHRRSIRLPAYDYAQPGAYFVTIGASQHRQLFGQVIGGVMGLNEVGQIVVDAWGEIPDHFPCVSNPVFIVMPDHFHGIVEINEKIENGGTELGEGARHASPVRVQARGRILPNSLGAIIGSFKSAVSRRVHQLPEYEKCSVWQRNYYEHIVRDQADYKRIVAYIQMNPQNWQNGKEN